MRQKGGRGKCSDAQRQQLYSTWYPSKLASARTIIFYMLHKAKRIGKSFHRCINELKAFLSGGGSDHRGGGGGWCDLMSTAHPLSLLRTFLSFGSIQSYRSLIWVLLLPFRSPQPTPTHFIPVEMGK